MICYLSDHYSEGIIKNGGFYFYGENLQVMIKQDSIFICNCCLFLKGKTKSFIIKFISKISLYFLFFCFYKNSSFATDISDLVAAAGNRALIIHYELWTFPQPPYWYCYCDPGEFYIILDNQYYDYNYIQLINSSRNPFCTIYEENCEASWFEPFPQSVDHTFKILPNSSLGVALGITQPIYFTTTLELDIVHLDHDYCEPYGCYNYVFYYNKPANNYSSTTSSIIESSSDSSSSDSSSSNYNSSSFSSTSSSDYSFNSSEFSTSSDSSSSSSLSSSCSSSSSSSSSNSDGSSADSSFDSSVYSLSFSSENFESSFESESSVCSSKSCVWGLITTSINCNEECPKCLQLCPNGTFIRCELTCETNSLSNSSNKRLCPSKCCINHR
jgi:hypothetical protein